MAKKIKIRVFNTLELNNVMVSGWYSYKDNPNKRYGLFTGATEGLEIEREADCMKFMKPNVGIISKNLWQIHIKVRHCDYDLMYEHEYKNWTDNICIAWLRSGNLGGDTVNWFFNGKKDCWYNGGKKGEELVVSHRHRQDPRRPVPDHPFCDRVPDCVVRAQPLEIRPLYLCRRRQ